VGNILQRPERGRDAVRRHEPQALDATMCTGVDLVQPTAKRRYRSQDAPAKIPTVVPGALRVIIHWLHRVVLQGAFDQQRKAVYRVAGKTGRINRDDDLIVLRLLTKPTKSGVYFLNYSDSS
jgi:hypothetical protein